MSSLVSSSSAILRTASPRPLLRRDRAETVGSDKIRIMVLGSKHVGKTSIVRRFIRLKFAEEYRSAANEKHFIESDRTIVKLMEAENFLLPSHKKMAISTASAFVLVYAVDNAESFEYVRAMRDEIIAIRGANVPMVVVGNKVDVPDREVHPVVADCVVTMDWECPHVEVSAKDVTTLNSIFQTLFFHKQLVAMLPSLADSKRNSFSGNRENAEFSEHVQQFSNETRQKRKRVQSFSRYILKKMFLKH